MMYTKVDILDMTTNAKETSTRKSEFALDRSKSLSFDWTEFERVFASGN